MQLDTTPITLFPGCLCIHFTAQDVVSRKDVLAAYPDGRALSAERFVREELPRIGFPIRALQTDEGSGFRASFEAACQGLGIQLYVLPPRSPRLNPQVERGHRTHQEEFCDLVEVPEDVQAHNALLREDEEVDNGPGPTGPWVTSPRTSSSPAARPITAERRQSVSDLLRQYTRLSPRGARGIVRS